MRKLNARIRKPSQTDWETKKRGFGNQDSETKTADSETGEPDSETGHADSENGIRKLYARIRKPGFANSKRGFRNWMKLKDDTGL